MSQAIRMALAGALVALLLQTCSDDGSATRIAVQNGTTAVLATATVTSADAKVSVTVSDLNINLTSGFVDVSFPADGKVTVSCNNACMAGDVVITEGKDSIITVSTDTTPSVTTSTSDSGSSSSSGSSSTSGSSTSGSSSSGGGW